MSVVHEHLRRAVFDVSNQVLLSLMTREPLSGMEELRTSKVANLNVSVIVNEHIVRLNVVVYNAQ